MRVLSIGFMYPPHDLGGGYEITWRSSVTQMRAQGHEVRVLASDFRRPETPAAATDYDVHRELRTYWQDHTFPRLRPKQRLELETHNRASLDRHLGEHAPDVVNWWAMGGMSLSLIEAVRRRGLPAVGVVGDDWLAWGPKVDQWLRMQRRIPFPRTVESWFGLPARVDLARAATWLFNSESVRSRALAAHPDLCSTKVVHPGIDDDLFRPAPAGPWRWRLLYLGRIDRRKGVHIAVESLVHLPEEAALTIQGSGDAGYLNEIRTLIRRLGLTERVSFSSVPRKDLPKVYADADAVLFPVQWNEPWGLVPLEAMAIGRPVVASGTGGSSEYLRDGENSLIYSPRDSPRALAEAVVRLGGDEHLRDDLREAGRRTAPLYTEGAYNDAIREALAGAARGAIGDSG